MILPSGILRDLFRGMSLCAVHPAGILPRGAGLLLICALLFSQACRPGEPGAGEQSLDGAPRLEAGAVKHLEIPEAVGSVALNTGEVHFRDFDLAPGELLHVLVEQQGVDVALSLRDPRGKEILRVDSPNGEHGPEELLQIAEIPGSYRVEIQSATQPEGGRYTLREASHRPAQPRDRQRLAADRLDREGRRLVREGSWPEAVQRLSQARDLWRRLGLHDREAGTLRQLGVALSASGDLPAAREAWERALSWHRTLGEQGRSYLLHDLGKLEARLGEAEAAVRYLEESRSLLERDGDERALVSALSALGAALRTQGSYQRAVECFETAAERSRRLDDPELEAAVQIDRGALLLDLDRTAEARAAYEKALGLYRSQGDLEGIALALRGVADAHLRAGALDLAEGAARDALAALETTEPSRVRIAVLSSLGNVRRKRADWAGARQAFEEALAAARAGEYRRDEANLLTGLAYVTARAGEPQPALALYDQALRLFREMENPGGEAMVQARSAEALRALGSLEDAWQRVDRALRIIEGLRAETQRQDHRLSYFGSRQEYYETAVAVLLDLESRKPGAAQRAFAVHERRLGRELLDALAPADPLRSAADPGLLAEEQRLEREISDLAGRGGLQIEPGNDGHLAEVIEDIQRVRGRLRTQAASGASSVETVDLAEVRSRLLDGDSLALIYALGAERSHLFEVSREDFRVHALPDRALIESKTTDFIQALRRTDRRSVARQTELGRELGSLLLRPAVDRLRSKIRLVVVADGALQELPFAALAFPGSEPRFLIESHEIVYLPSLSALSSLRSADARRPVGGGRLAVFADPDFGDGEQASPAAGPYPPLPGARREAQALLRLWGGASVPLVAVGAAANRETLMQTDWSGFEALYFATHAVGHRQPGLSGLVLALRDASGRPQPGFVSGLEIARLSLPVDLVVLAACETASGDRVRGEGTLGLSWSFLQAGASRVVATLWKVDDRRTADLMTRFLELYRRGGLAPVDALHRAQRESLKRPGALPRDWAGFVFIGDWWATARRPADGAPRRGR